jgi:hypothetical protein
LIGDKARFPMRIFPDRAEAAIVVFWSSQSSLKIGADHKASIGRERILSA